MKLGLYVWQEECLALWFNNGCKGIVNVVTGAGKTVLAAAAIARLLQTVPDADQLRVKIVVPKTFLVRQWGRALREHLNAAREEIGVVYAGARKNASDRRYMIYVIHSARYALARHILHDLSAFRPVLLIADECHHYGTDENAKIFDFYPWRMKDQPGWTRHAADLRLADRANVYTLGLSATPYCAHYGDVLVPCLGPEIYHFSFQHALNDGIIHPFAVFHVCLGFSGPEQDVYNELTDRIGISLTALHRLHPHIGAHNPTDFFKELIHLIGTGDKKSAAAARTVLLLTYQRKRVVCHAAARVRCVLDLVPLLRRDAKIVIFGERIETADEIYAGLRAHFPNEIGLYHSGVHKSVGEAALKRFEDGEIRILISCKTLDEGLSVTSADVGIIVSSANSSRQRIQRLGRILRKKDSGRPAYLYYLYIEGTTEESDIMHDYTGGRLARHISAIDLRYDGQSGVFSNPYYDSLSETVRGHAVKNGWHEAEIYELERNILKGLVACDWWLTEEACKAQIQNAKDKSERNYYLTMMNLIRARTK